MKNEYSKITPYIRKLAELSAHNNKIVPEMYTEHKVNRGLRDMNGNGVVTGLTEISDIKAKEKGPDGQYIPCKGELYYRGINVRDLVNGFLSDHRLGLRKPYIFCFFPNCRTRSNWRNSVRRFRIIAVCRRLLSETLF